ncbi:MAG: cyclic nucleotide-binding domain-containing protein [Alphaproteobacteria bacterium]|nr:cyclic nucleotide-binding domain-containing protein [Alphaproteobacteria bacterium]
MEDDDDFLALFRHETAATTLIPGQLLFAKGEPAQQMFIVKSGELQIGEGNIVFETVRAGGILGEMAMVDDSPRSASVRAVTECELIPVDKRRFLTMLQQTPFFAVRVMRVLTRRLRAMNERMTQI